MVAGSFEVREFAGVQDLSQILASVGNDQAIMASLPADGRSSGQLVTKAEKANHPGALSRNKEDCLASRPNSPAFAFSTTIHHPALRP
jgi:hypothetical protein